MAKERTEIPSAEVSSSHRERVEEIKRRAVEQHKAFVEAARQAGADESEETFDKALKRLASAPAPKTVQKRKPQIKKGRRR